MPQYLERDMEELHHDTLALAAAVEEAINKVGMFAGGAAPRHDAGAVRDLGPFSVPFHLLAGGPRR